MKQVIFQTFGQIQTDKDVILVSILPKDFIKDLPQQFTMQGILEPKTIYTGSAPTIKFNPDSVRNIYEQFKGRGIAGAITNIDWYCVEREVRDILGIGL